MTSPRWKSLKFFRTHMDPEKDDQLKWTTLGNSLSPKHPQSFQYNWRSWDGNIDTKRKYFSASPTARSYPDLGLLRYAEHQRLRQAENNMKRILKLIKGMNFGNGNKEANLKRRSEIIQLLEEFHTQYQSLYALYDDLREGVRKKFRVEEDDDSSSSSSLESDSYYSPDESGSNHSRSRTPRSQKGSFDNTPKPEAASDVEDTSEVVKEALNVEPVSSSNKDDEVEVDDEGENKTEQLGKETGFLMEKLEEGEKELFSLKKAHRVLENEASAKIQELDDEVTTLKLEVVTLNIERGEFEGQLESKAIEVSRLGEENSRLRSQIAELESSCKEKGDEISAAIEKFRKNENLLMAKIDEFKEKVKNLETEVGSLRSQIGETRQSTSSETNDGLARVNGLTEEIQALELQLASLKTQKAAIETELEQKSSLRENFEGEKGAVNELRGLEIRLKDLEMVNDSLRSEKTGLEESLRTVTDEVNQSKSENEQLNSRVSELQEKVKQKENEISSVQSKVKNVGMKDDVMSSEVSSLKSQVKDLLKRCDSLLKEKQETEMKLEKEKAQMEDKIIALKNKISEQEKALKEREDTVSKLNQEHKQAQVQFSDSKSALRIAERKMEEMAEEFRKKFEDNIRLLSRRIRVAEQLHAENKEWYKNTIDKCEQDQKENEAALEQFRTMSGMASETLAESETVALKFVECCEHFMNRISKASCELNFARDWVRRKNGAIKQVKEDSDCLLAQLDDKEGEILGSRHKVWRLENKVRELEKMVSEKEEGFLVLKEEKREAIRQLCVWIDYHRGRSDYLKKIVTDLQARYQARSPS